MLPTLCLILPAFSISRICRSCIAFCLSAVEGTGAEVEARRRRVDALARGGAKARGRSWDEMRVVSGRGRDCMVGRKEGCD